MIALMRLVGIIEKDTIFLALYLVILEKSCIFAPSFDTFEYKTIKDLLKLHVHWYVIHKFNEG